MASVTILSDNGATSGSAGLKTSGGNDGVLILQTTTSGGTATNAVYINTSQNVGLGVTPSAWNSSYKAFQIADVGVLAHDSVNAGHISLGSNYYRDSTPTWRYISSASATRYTQYVGEHQWFTTASGTAGNAITWTQAMTLDANGNLAVNTTSPTNPANKNITVNGGSTDAAFVLSVADTRIGQLYAASGNEVRLSAITSVPLTFRTADTERMRIDASGNLGVNTTSPQGRVESKTATVVGGDAAYAKKAFVANIPLSTANVVSSLVAGFDSTIHGVDVGYSYDGTGYYLAFATNSTTSGSPTERARIDRSGNLSVGITSTSNRRLYVKGDTSASGTYLTTLENSSATAVNTFGLQIYYSGSVPNSGASQFFDCLDTGGLRVRFKSNGGLDNYSANNSNLSDRREKTNFAPAGDYLAKICAIPVQTFNYIDQNLEEDDGLTLGVVAQDVQAVAPELVMESNWGTQEEPKMRLSIYQTDLQYALMKCIQEQQAIITQLQSDVAALKGQA